MIPQLCVLCVFFATFAVKGLNAARKEKLWTAEDAKENAKGAKNTPKANQDISE